MAWIRVIDEEQAVEASRLRARGGFVPLLPARYRLDEQSRLGDESLKRMAPQSVASWNHITDWLYELDLLRQTTPLHAA